MPNHITNELLIKCPNEGIRDLLIESITVESEGHRLFSCGQIIPQPPIIKAVGDAWQGAKTQHEARGWYRWSIRVWGTKWDAYSQADPRVLGLDVVFEFQTAWAPPTPVLIELAQLFPDCDIEHLWHDDGADTIWHTEIGVTGPAAVGSLCWDDEKEEDVATWMKRFAWSQAFVIQATGEDGAPR